MATTIRWMTPAIAIAALALCLGGCEKGATSGSGAEAKSSGADGGSSGDADKGKQVFQTTCATCHGMDAEGVKGLGKPLHKNDFVKQSKDDELAAMINEGRAADHPRNTTGVVMPPKGGNPSLTDQDIKDVIAYLRTLQ